MSNSCGSSGRNEFEANLPRAVQALESSIAGLLGSAWEELHRARAHELAVALTQAAKEARCWETEGILRPIASLLSLSERDGIPVRQGIGQKLLALIGLLKKVPASRTA